MRPLNILLLAVCLHTSVSLAQEAAVAGASQPAAKKLPSQEELFKTFAELLNKSVMVGTFTVDVDTEQKLRSESYEISKVVKQPQGDYWNFLARIKYGDHNVMVPIPVEVKWAGDTPVITVDNLTIPSLGTFDARVVISDNKYAGTWRHGKVGGLMFGHIEKQAEKSQAAENSAAEKDDTTKNP